MYSTGKETVNQLHGGKTGDVPNPVMLHQLFQNHWTSCFMWPFKSHPWFYQKWLGFHRLNVLITTIPRRNAVLIRLFQTCPTITSSWSTTIFVLYPINHHKMVGKTQAPLYVYIYIYIHTSYQVDILWHIHISPLYHVCWLYIHTVYRYIALHPINKSP